RVVAGSAYPADPTATEQAGGAAVPAGPANGALIRAEPAGPAGASAGEHKSGPPTVAAVPAGPEISETACATGSAGAQQNPRVTAVPAGPTEL
ncbi:hypothetical protein BST27_31115, partial [Mycobacterium intermedium]